MSRTARLLMFGVGAAGLGVVLVYGLGGILIPFAGIKLIDLALVMARLA